MADSLKVKLAARVKLIKNTSQVLVDQLFEPADADFTKRAALAFTILTNTSAILPQAGIAAVRHALVQVDNPANIKINGGTNSIPLTTSGCFFIANASVTEIKVVNDSTTLDVSVEYGLSD